MKFALCFWSLALSVTPVLPFAPPIVRTSPSSTRQWAAGGNADKKVAVLNDAIAKEVAEEVVQEVTEEKKTVPKVVAKEQASNVPPELSPAEDEQVLSRDEKFMRLAIELAEEEYVWQT